MMNKRVYGVSMIKSIMANWNADFSGNPKSISTGEIFGSDKAFKYPIKRMWQEKGEKVLYIKSLKADDKKGEVKIRPKSLKERYEEIFEVEELKKQKDNTEVLKNLFSATDVKNFGATFAEEGNNISITGAVQINQGFNKYEDTSVEEQQILSPFRDAKSKKKDNEEPNATTLGSKIVSDEAHYAYGFCVNPLVYSEYVKMGVTQGYQEEDYKKFKEATLVAATAFNTNAKMGCENELSVFIETEQDLYLPDLSQYVTFKKCEDKNIIVLEFDNMINKLGDKILNVEIYYNPYTTELKENINKAKKFNIFTREALE